MAAALAMPASLKIDRARFVITLDPARRVLQDGSIVVDGPRITHVGKAADLQAMSAERTIDASGYVVTPAFVNTHMHISYAHAVRGIFPDDFVGRERLVEVFRLQLAMTEEEEYSTSLLAVAELMKSGCVTFLDPGSTKYLDACLQVYADAGCRVVTGTSLIDQPDPRPLPYFSTDEALAKTEQFIRAYNGRLDGRVRAWAMPFGTQNASRDLLVGAKRLADEYGTGMTLHHAGGNVDGRRATEYLEAIGVVGPNVVLAHLTGISDSEVECIARTGTCAAFCPTTTVKEASGIGQSKVPELLERGVSVGIGNDSGNSSNHLDTIRSMNIAALGFKDARRDVRLVPAEQALEMATLLGARALGLGAEIGSIEVGKQADLVLFDTRRAEWAALFDPVTNLVYSADGRSVQTVIAGGRIVVDDSRALFLDEPAVVDSVQELGEALLARTGIKFSRGRWPII
jgi:cytosine/adenosine deaminase-related metal-dependent hydrolase